MQRLGGRKVTEKAPETERKDKEKEVNWQEMEGYSGWFLYMLSKYLPLGMYPIRKRICTGKKLKMLYKMNLCRLKGQIGLLDISWMYNVKGVLGECTIERLKISNTEMEPILWEVVKRSRVVQLIDVEIRECAPEYFSSSISVDILGSSADQIKHSISSILSARKRRVCVESKSFLFLWDEGANSLLAAKNFNVSDLLQYIHSVNILYLDRVEVSSQIIDGLGRYAIKKIRLDNCYILPLKVYDLISVCRTHLRILELYKTLIPFETIEHIRGTGIDVKVII